MNRYEDSRQRAVSNEAAADEGVTSPKFVLNTTRNVFQCVMRTGENDTAKLGTDGESLLE